MVIGSLTPAQFLLFSRKLCGLTQREVAAKLGTDERSIRCWEHGTEPLPVFQKQIQELAPQWIKDALGRADQ